MEAIWDTAARQILYKIRTRSAASLLLHPTLLDTTLSDDSRGNQLSEFLVRHTEQLTENVFIMLTEQG